MNGAIDKTRSMDWLRQVLPKEQLRLVIEPFESGKFDFPDIEELEQENILQSARNKRLEKELAAKDTTLAAWIKKQMNSLTHLEAHSYNMGIYHGLEKALKKIESGAFTSQQKTDSSPE